MLSRNASLKPVSRRDPHPSLPMPACHALAAVTLMPRGSECQLPARGGVHAGTPGGKEEVGEGEVGAKLRAPDGRDSGPKGAGIGALLVGGEGAEDTGRKVEGVT